MDWKNIIKDLQIAGLTQPQIATKCGCSQPTISDLFNGKTIEPRHSLGQSLLKLHRRLAAKYRASDRNFNAVNSSSV